MLPRTTRQFNYRASFGYFTPEMSQNGRLNVKLTSQAQNANNVNSRTSRNAVSKGASTFVPSSLKEKSPRYASRVFEKRSNQPSFNSTRIALSKKSDATTSVHKHTHTHTQGEREMYMRTQIHTRIQTVRSALDFSSTSCGRFCHFC